MAFDLEVEFTGLCLYVRHKENKQVTVLMPDCRRGVADDMHADDTRGSPHVGYLRVNLANMAHLPHLAEPADADDTAGAVPEGDPIDGPKFELVYQFDKEQLKFGVNGHANIKPELGLPDFSVILPGRDPDEKLFTKKPPESLLFRTVLKGGTLIGRRGGGNWVLKGVTAGGSDYQGQFAEVITWRREVDDDELDLTLTAFDGKTKKKKIRLKPTKENGKLVIRLKIANLCSTNPLEWDSLDLHKVTTKDQDFKWLYRLFGPPDIAVLPTPEQTSDLQAFGTEDCTGGEITGDGGDGGDE